MAAYEIPNLRFSGESAGVIARRRFVKIDANELVEQVAVNTDEVVGVSAQPTTAAGQVAEIYDGIVIVEAGAQITAGQAVMSDADGKAIPYVSGTGVNKAGKAVTNAAAAGELLSVKL
jgi:hypothetical protein